MPKCEVCGNEYDKPLEVRRNQDSHVYDCFKCAIQALAFECRHCGCWIIGHSVEIDGRIFCSTRCAKADAVQRGSSDPEVETIAGA
jgi:hypothetical protein